MAYTPYTLATFGSDGMMVASAQAGDPSVARIWTYVTADAQTTVRAANYFSDAERRNMSENDIIFVITTAGGAPSTFYVSAAISVAVTGADVADGTAITLTNS